MVFISSAEIHHFQSKYTCKMLEIEYGGGLDLSIILCMNNFLQCVSMSRSNLLALCTEYSFCLLNTNQMLVEYQEKNSYPNKAILLLVVFGEHTKTQSFKGSLWTFVLSVRSKVSFTFDQQHRKSMSVIFVPHL